MTVWQALILGIVQGLTEPLPVSSSAHLILVPHFMGWPDSGLSFDVALHLGTLLALLSYFRHDWIEMISSAWRVARTRRVESTEDRRLIFLIVATIPGWLAGLLLNDLAETTFRSPAIIAVTLTALGVLLWWIDRKYDQSRQLDSMTVRDAIIIGCAQMCALVPGVSRSGATMTAGRWLRLDRPAAARFSFLMSMPITFAAVVFKVPEAIGSQNDILPLIVGVLAAAVSGWLAIAVLLRFVVRHSFGVFAAYRIMLGAVVLWTLVLR